MTRRALVADSGRIIRHDLGSILGEGQTIRREFSLPNRASNPLRLLSAEALMPCCSEVEPLPGAAIGPGEAAKVGVTFRPGRNSGAKFVRFTVRTDDPDRPTIELVLSARVYPRWEFRPGDVSTAPVLVGQSARRVGRGIGHGRVGDRSLIPTAVESSGGIVASLTGRSEEAPLPDGLIEARCEVAIDLPASGAPGPRRGGLAFRWADGRVEQQNLAWVVDPAIVAVPSALVLKVSSARREVRTIQLRSADRPFRVRSVSGIGLATPVSLPDGPSRTHRLDLEFDPAALRPEADSAIRIETDHGDAPVVKLGVLVLAAPKESPR